MRLTETTSMIALHGGYPLQQDQQQQQQQPAAMQHRRMLCMQSVTVQLRL
jgi:hypothetical protein